MRKWLAGGATAVVAGTALLLNAAPASASTTYTVWATNVNFRQNTSSACVNFPSTSTCADQHIMLNPGDRITPSCQHKGQTIGSNPYWVYDQAKSHWGWVASWYIDYPSNTLPGVPIC